MTRVGAVIAAIRSHRAGSGALRWVAIAGSSLQSYGVGSPGESGTGRGGSEDQPVEGVRPFLRDEGGGEGSERVPDHDDAVKVEGVQEGEYIVAQQLV
jgi:hypothetical protein